jgi:hypothetical protein
LLAFRTLFLSSKYPFAFQDDRDRNDHCKIFRRSLVVVLHRQDSARAFAHQHDQGGVIEQLGIGSAHVEPTKRIGVRWKGRDGCKSNGNGKGESSEARRHVGDGGTDVLRSAIFFWSSQAPEEV